MNTINFGMLGDKWIRGVMPITRGKTVFCINFGGQTSLNPHFFFCMKTTTKVANSTLIWCSSVRMSVFMKVLIFFVNMRGESSSNIEAMKEKNKISNCQNNIQTHQAHKWSTNLLGSWTPNSSNFPSHALKSKWCSNLI